MSMNSLALKTFSDIEQVYFFYIQNEDDRNLIKRAYQYAEQKHQGIFRKSGEPYIHHLLEVAYILATLQGGPSTIAAGFLHDVVEDTDTTVEDLKRLFNDDVASLVESLTKIQQLKLSQRDKKDFLAEDHRKIFIGMARDIRVIIIKLADRLHNMRTLQSLSPERQQALSKETRDVFSPIAHRLGMFSIKSELEDISLKYLEPEKYESIVHLLEQKKLNRDRELDEVKKKIADILFAKQIPFTIESRIKSIFSIYRKLYLQNHNIDDIYDIYAIRVITDSVPRCYEVLGLVHNQFTPIQQRFKDYIAVPKPNLYQSLHTTISSNEGKFFEVQIRTKEMNEIAETGVAAHWRYKEGKNYNPKSEQKEIEEKLFWFRDFVSMTAEEGDAKEVMENLQKDLFETSVFVFTPRGKVIDLPNGSTPLDFAYRVHTGVGHSAVGALVNGTLVPLNTVLKTGDVVDIKTSTNSPGPNEGWLKIVQTNSAKGHIKKFLFKKNNEMLRDDKIHKGKQSCEDAFKDRGFNAKEMIDILTKNVAKLLSHYGYPSLDDLFIAMSNRNPQPGAVIDLLNIKKKFVLNLGKKKEQDIKSSVVVPNAGKVAITLGSCCTPIPGDDIVGFITKGKGITVHRLNCPNIKGEQKRLTDVFWNENIALQTYPVDITVECNDRTQLLVDVMGVFSQLKVSVTSINAVYHPMTSTTTISATIYASDAKRLNDVFNVLLNISSVYDVKRVIH
jgi:GTP diphosphokinase / guanosine-3',5'-bis(diphosphate) 3'-diphosphatase